VNCGSVSGVPNESRRVRDLGERHDREDSHPECSVEGTGSSMLLDSKTDPAMMEDRKTKRAGDGFRGHILVVEDDLIIADLIDQILRFESFHVSHVVDGQSAVTFAETQQPDLILMDLMLPVMSGIDACRIIKSSPLPGIADIPIVAMSAGVNLRAAAGDLPVNGVLAKPFDIDELLATVSVHVRDES
jgi:CheY-like chemotaxis protein